MKFIMEWKIGNNQQGRAELNFPLLDENDLDGYIARLKAFIVTVNKLNTNLKKCKAVVTRRVEK